MEMSLKDLKDLLETDSQSHPWKVGQSYFVQTVTNYFTGRLTAIHAGELVLADAAWIADTGRLADAIKSGNFSEIEPYTHDLIISRGSIVSATQYPFELPRNQK